MKIGDVAHQTGLTTTTIRYYEDIGLVPPPARAPNGYRDYGPEAVERLRFIRDAQDSGLTLSEVASILELRGQGESTCHHVIELMERHLADVDRRIERLQRESRALRRAHRPGQGPGPGRLHRSRPLPDDRGQSAGRSRRSSTVAGAGGATSSMEPSPGCSASWASGSSSWARPSC